MQAFSALTTDDINLITPYLNSNNSADTFGALVGLLKYGGNQGVSLSREKLEKLASHSLKENCILAAQALRKFGSSDFDDVLLKLMKDDEDVDIRREALLAAGKRSISLWRNIIYALSDLKTRDAAAKALEEGGEFALPFMERAFRDTGTPKVTRIKLAKVFGNIRGENAIRILAEEISASENDLREAVLAG